MIFEAIPKDETDQARGYRGYVAVDDIIFQVEQMGPETVQRFPPPPKNITSF